MEKKKVLFVCLGNICRSPLAETVFRSYVAKAGLADVIEIDSAGLYHGHAGELADPRMRQHAQRRGYEITHRARRVGYEDFFEYDYIIGMDEQNRQGLKSLAPTKASSEKISLLMDWVEQPLMNYVPDPYYGGAEGFEQVIDLVESAMAPLLEAIQRGVEQPY